MSEDTLPPLREVIARHGLAARKALGQNFLFDLNLTRRIARAPASVCQSNAAITRHAASPRSGAKRAVPNW